MSSRIRKLKIKENVGTSIGEPDTMVADNDMETAVGKTIGGTPGTTMPRARAKATSVLFWRHTDPHHQPGDAEAEQA